jgi:cyanobactin maturation PatA/PatG family protease
MCEIETIPGLSELWRRTTGDKRIRVAIIDGPIDVDHDAFAGVELASAGGLWPAEDAFDGPMAAHGTQVASVIFGRHDGPVRGLAPTCAGIGVAAFSDRRRRTSQLDLARAIELAVESGAHVVNISGGELTASGAAEDFLDRAVRLCAERNVLLVAAAGNDGCFCEHVPAALPSVLAVGALDDAGTPLPSSNWGAAYEHQGLLAPGHDVLGAVPGGGVRRSTGTSFAAPIVAGAAALLLSLQVQAGEEPDPLGVRRVLLACVDPCELGDTHLCQRFLAGKLNMRRAMSAVMSEMTPAEAEPEPEVLTEHACACGGGDLPAAPVAVHTGASASEELAALTAAVTAALERLGAASPSGAAIVPSSADAGYRTAVAERQPSRVTLSESASPYVFALGTLGYDFGSEARRDAFKQAMPSVAIADGIRVPANPYDARQIVDYLAGAEPELDGSPRLPHPSDAKALIWTLNMEYTPIYAIEPAGPYAAAVYALLVRFLAGEIEIEHQPGYIERVSIPGRLTDRNVKLFSGQTVPVVEVEQERGLSGWELNALIAIALQTWDALPPAGPDETRRTRLEVERALREFLTRVYYDLRNLGNTSRDRALNFAATNLFQSIFVAQQLGTGMSLDTIGVEKSPFCRPDSDCWDVKLRFFDPENSRRARSVFRYTVDVSDILPVTLGDVRHWSEAG